jgi:hypothetical protein
MKIKKIKGYIIVHPKTGRPENGFPELYPHKVQIEFPDEEKCVACEVRYEIYGTEYDKKK